MSVKKGQDVEEPHERGEGDGRRRRGWGDEETVLEYIETRYVHTYQTSPSKGGVITTASKTVADDGC